MSRRHFTYANVMSSLALFLVVAGGSVAIATVSKSEVASKHVKDNALKSKDLKDGAGVADADVVPNSLTGKSINEATLTLPPASSSGASGPAGGSLAGTYPNPTLAANSVDTAQIVDNAVNSAKVAADTLTAADLANDSVGTSEIADNAVNSAKVAADTLTAADLANDSVGTSEIADNAVNSAKVAANSLADDDLALDSVGNSELGLRAVSVENLGGFGTLNTNFGGFLAQTCSTRAVDITNLGPGNNIFDDVLAVTPDVDFTSDNFSLTAKPFDGDTATVMICNNGPTDVDPDGGATTTLRVTATDFP